MVGCAVDSLTEEEEVATWDIIATVVATTITEEVIDKIGNKEVQCKDLEISKLSSASFTNKMETANLATNVPLHTATQTFKP